MLVNMSSVYNLGALEDWLGSWGYLQLTATLCALTSLVHLASLHVAVAHLGRDWPRTTFALGYSGVV